MQRLSVLAFSMLLFLLVLTGCQKQSNIDLVKNGVLEFDKSLTVGQAIENYTLAKKVTWDAGESENGRNFVNCTIALDVEKTAYAGKGIEMSFFYQFVINKDDSFNVSACKSVVSSPDKEPIEANSTLRECINGLRDVYNGRTDF